MIRRSFALMIVGAWLGMCTPAAQTLSTPAQKLSERAAQRLEALHAEADRLASQERTLLGDLRRLELESQIRAEELDQAKLQSAAATTALEALDAEVRDLEQDIASALPDVESRLVTLYKLGRGRYARLLLSATDLRQFGQAVRFVSAVAEQDRQHLVEQQSRLAGLAAARRRAEERQAQVRELQSGAERAQAASAEAVSAHAALVRDIDSKRDLNAQYASELMAAQQRLQSSLNGLAPAAPGTLPLEPFKGTLGWPVSGTLVHGFGQSVAGRPPARGIEVQAPAGAAVSAVLAGTVVFADAFDGYGRLVIVDHGGQTLSLYGNLAEITTAKGAHVDEGVPVGVVGSASPASAVMYFELRVDGHAVDPLQWLEKR